MSVELRMPNITASTEREQLAQIRSYLYQFIPQLQWALNTIETPSASNNVVIQSPQNVAQKSVDAEVSFNAIKSLIIKSADIVEAYYEEINSRLVSAYRALSDFGTYTEQTEKLVTDTASFTKEAYSRLSTIESDIDGIISRETKGYIQTGIVVDSLSADEAEKYGKKEGDSLIGIEVGEEIDGKFTRYARFTSNRLSFYDQNDSEVAYISNYKLYITNAEITGKLTLGAFQIDTTKGFNLKYVGRG